MARSRKIKAKSLNFLRSYNSRMWIEFSCATWVKYVALLYLFGVGLIDIQVVIVVAGNNNERNTHSSQCRSHRRCAAYISGVPLA